MKELMEVGVVVTTTRTTTLACGDKGKGALMKPRDAVELINASIG